MQVLTNFEGIDAKTKRACAQINALKTDMAGLCLDIQKAIVHETHEDANKQEWIFRGEKPDVPIEWSVRIGEILYNLRSALDHLVWRLVITNGDTPGRHNEFPIVNDITEWDSHKSRKLRGVSSRVENMINRLQPYFGGMNLSFDVSAFWTLATLCNIDKHRHLNLVVAVSSGVEPIVFGFNHAPLHRPEGSLPLRGLGDLGEIKRDMVLLCLEDATVDLHPSFQIDLRFENTGEPEATAGTVPSILDECLKTVQGAVDLFKNELL